jgi:hypothetical protein
MISCQKSKTSSTACEPPFIAGLKISNADSTYQHATFYAYSKGSNFTGTHSYYPNQTVSNGEALYNIDATHDWVVTIDPVGKTYHIKDITLEPATKDLTTDQVCVEAFSYTLDDSIHHVDGYSTPGTSVKSYLIPVN